MDIRTALITGASSGLGEALARKMARDGTEVVLAARRRELLENIAEDIRRDHGAARVLPLDVRDAEATRNAIRSIDDDVGGLDLVVANAGVNRIRWSGKLEWEHCEETLAVNVAGTVATLTAAVPRMVERGHGHVAAISSLAKYRGLPRFASYSASKAFISTFLESLRVDLRTTGVAVTDVRPGFIRTPFNEGHQKNLPFLMEADDAAEIIWRGLRDRRAVVELPWQVARYMRGVAQLPPAVYDRVAKKIL